MVGIDDLLAGLERVSKAGEGWRACCPAHDDSTPSLSIGIGDDNRILIRCHSGCGASAIVGALGYELKDLFPQDTNTVQPAQGPRRPSAGSSARKSPLSVGTLDAAIASAKRSAAKELGATTTLVGDYSYALVDDGELRVLRFENDDSKKTFRQISTLGEGWVPKGSKSKALPFRHEAVAKAATVWIVEGEKCVDALVALGIEATTSAGGANAALKTDWSCLNNKALTLVPDNDDPGVQYVEAVQKLVMGRSVRLLELPGLEVGGDVADFIDEMRGKGHDDPAIKAELLRLASEVPPASRKTVTPSREPFPLDVLPRPARAMVEAIARSRAVDPSAVSAAVLSAISAGVGLSRIFYDDFSKWTETGTVWLALVARSGSRKSIIIDDLFAPHMERQRRLVAEHAAAESEHQRLFDAWEARRGSTNSGDEEPRPLPPEFEHVYTSDTTQEGLVSILAKQPRGVIIIADELNSFFGNFGRYSGNADAERSFYLSLFRGLDYKKDRAGAAPVFIERASAGIVGGIQPLILAKSFDAQAMASGLASRFLLVDIVPSVKTYEAGPTRDERSLYEKFIYDLYGLQLDQCSVEGGVVAQSPLQVGPSKEARVLLKGFIRRWSEESLLSQEHMQAAMSKLEAYAIRVALLRRVCREVDGSARPEDEISREDMEAGIRVAWWFRERAVSIYEDLAGPESHQSRVRLEMICEVIRSRFRGCVTLSEWRRRNRKRDKNVAESELDSLVDAGLAEKRKRSPGTAGGKPTVEYALLDGDHESEEEGVSGIGYPVPGVPPQEEQKPTGEPVGRPGLGEEPEILEGGYQKPPTQDPTHPPSPSTPLEGNNTDIGVPASPPEPPGTKYPLPQTPGPLDPAATLEDRLDEPESAKTGEPTPATSGNFAGALAPEADSIPGEPTDPESDAHNAAEHGLCWKQDDLFEHEEPAGGLGDE